MHAPEESSPAADEGARRESGWRHLVRWSGHFHPPLTAFPIAMLLGAALAEGIRLYGGAAWFDGAVRWCVIVGASTAVVAAPLGWAFATERGGSRVLEIHRWLGTAAAGVGILILILSELGHRRGGAWLIAFRAVLFISVPLVIATGFFGGAMVYGTHAYDWNLSHQADGR